MSMCRYRRVCYRVGSNRSGEPTNDMGETGSTVIVAIKSENAQWRSHEGPAEESKVSAQSDESERSKRTWSEENEKTWSEWMD